MFHSQAVLNEKEKHLERLIQEKDLDRHELAEKTSQLESLSGDLQRLREELNTVNSWIPQLKFNDLLTRIESFALAYIYRG